MEISEKEIIEVSEKIRICEEEISKGIIGQKDIIRNVLIAIFADGNVLLEGMPGMGKTQLVKTIGKVLNLSFSRIQFTPDLMPADVVGTNIVVKENDRTLFKFEKGPVFTNLLLADEINRATPKTQSALLEAMGEKTVTVGKTTYEMAKPFMVLATQNPIEQEGTYPLPEAQLDRFLFKLNVDFPNLQELKEIMDLTLTNNKVQIDAVLEGDEILKIREIIREIKLAEAVKEFALKLILATHPEIPEASEFVKRYVEAGASPRAAQGIISGAKVRAVMEGRLNVSFEDIKALAYPVLRHRIILNFDAITEGLTEESIIDKILEDLKVV
ncbi:MoxR family ATPase [Clostridium tertium]|jgi:MoxR-like ATPase|uniref:AAA family ATPase n=1 Tax=Clostridium TaxID=1485 RepID=UPI001158ED74|nr:MULTISPECIES: MoxR family ATPase [Clostridium]MBS5307886.1 MoxR family ATPase [Clostridium sp.]MDB1921286.1 MoxR family ATPase [Clostridium tertium]MDB1924531.1 MoxR family ATPase [Clostridium tertium]MDB1928061.1 MoxR family ATPase [Clostridium tertium]MDB1933637.1 MoxR family ATPase [Clostridium tertium]